MAYQQTSLPTVSKQTHSRMRGYKRLVQISGCALVIVLSSAGCTRNIMPTPNVYASGNQALFATLDPDLKSNQVDILYVTDRAREDDGSGKVTYGYGRSPSLAYGSAIVQFGDDTVTWEQLKDYSKSPTNAGMRLPLKIIEITELGRLPATPYLFQETQGTEIELDPIVVEAQKEMLSRMSNFDIIICQGRAAGSWGHSYYLDNPAVSSDILMLLRYGSEPGSAKRPLRRLPETHIPECVEFSFVFKACQQAHSRAM